MQTLTVSSTYPRERCSAPPFVSTQRVTVAVPWRALIVHPTREVTALERLQHGGIDAYLPLIEGRPLISGYVFARYHASLRTYAYQRSPYIVRALEQPVTDHEITWLRTLCASGLALSHGEILHEGDHVRVQVGKLAGIEGRLREIDGETHLSVEIPILQRTIIVQVERDQVRRA